MEELTLEEVEALERAYHEAIARGEETEVDRFSWEPGDVILHNSEEEMRREMAKEGYEFIPASKAKANLERAQRQRAKKKK